MSLQTLSCARKVARTAVSFCHFGRSHVCGLYYKVTGVRNDINV